MRGRPHRPIVAVVDDDATVRAALERLLLSMNLFVQTYTSAEEFLLRADCDSLDCLLLDVQLRGASGLELTRHLARTNAEIPIILLTANPALIEQDATAARHARAVLLKPVEAALLAATLDEVDAVIAGS